MGCGLSRARTYSDTYSEVLVSHAHARTTVHGRRLIVERHLEPLTPAESRNVLVNLGALITRGNPALHNPGFSRGLKPPLSSSWP